MRSNRSPNLENLVSSGISINMIPNKNIIKAARTSKPGGIFVTEFLIKKKLGLLKELRRLKNDEEKFSAVWTRNGRIFVKDDDTSTPREVKRLEEA